MKNQWLRERSVDQLLFLLVKVKDYHRLGFDIETAYKQSVSKTSKQFRVAYQTIGDLCRRRLGLDNIYQFYKVLQNWIDGDPSNLKNLIINHVSVTDRKRINNFLLDGESEIYDEISNQIDLLESIHINLEKKTIKSLKLIAENEGISMSDWIGNEIARIVDERTKDWIREQLERLTIEERQALLKDVL